MKTSPTPRHRTHSSLEELIRDSGAEYVIFDIHTKSRRRKCTLHLTQSTEDVLEILCGISAHIEDVDPGPAYYGTSADDGMVIIMPAEIAAEEIGPDIKSGPAGFRVPVTTRLLNLGTVDLTVVGAEGFVDTTLYVQGTFDRAMELISRTRTKGYLEGLREAESMLSFICDVSKADAYYAPPEGSLFNLWALGKINDCSLTELQRQFFTLASEDMDATNGCVKLSTIVAMRHQLAWHLRFHPDNITP